MRARMNQRQTCLVQQRIGFTKFINTRVAAQGQGDQNTHKKNLTSKTLGAS